MAVAVLAVGGALRGVQAAVAVLTAATVLVQVRSRSSFDRTSPLLVLLGLAIGLTALQVIPLPSGLVAMLQPVGDALRSDGAALVGAAPSSTISLDVPGSLRALAFYITLAGVAIVALRLAVSERGRYWILVGVAGICAASALIVGVHQLLGLRSLYGIYAPEHATPAVLGPLLNENQLGCLMAVGSVTAFGLAMYRRQRSWLRVLWLLVTAMTAVATMVSHSRGAALALFGGIVIAGGVLVGQRVARPPTHQRRRAEFLTRTLPIGVIAACTVLVVVYASAGEISRELDRTTLQEVRAPKTKYATWRSSVVLIEESPWFGVGRGAFETAFTRVHSASAFATFSHLENEYIQAVVDWGIPGALLLGIAAVWLVVVAIRRWRDGPLAAGGLGALTILALQSNVDFGLEVLGLAVPATLIVATLVHQPLREAKARALMVSRGVRIGVGVVLLGCAAMLISPMTTSAAEDRAALRGRPNLSLADLRPAIERHPLDYYEYALASQVASRTRVGSAVRLLNHSLTLHPSHPGLHLMAARWLFQTGRVEQATIEYAAALRGTVDPRKLLGEISSVFSAELAARAIPIEHEPLEIVSLLEGMERPRVATAWLSRVLGVKPGNARICEMLYDLSLKREDLKLVDLTTRRCEGFEPSPSSKLQLAQLLVKKKKPADALLLLKDAELWPGQISVKLQAWLLSCDIYIEQRTWSDAKRCIRRLDSSGYQLGNLRPELLRRLEQIDVEIRKDLEAERVGSGSGSGSATKSPSAAGSGSAARIPVDAGLGSAGSAGSGSASTKASGSGSASP